MFTGIIEELAEVVSVTQKGGNVDLKVKSNLTKELKIDQSVAHNGCCLTVVEIENDTYTVTAIEETLNRTTIGLLKAGDAINLERCTKIGARLDGHIVQGHVDTLGTCTKVVELDGSWEYYFEYETEDVTVAKGSITVNGTSLTVCDSGDNNFSVAIIPYTYDNTFFKYLEVGGKVNLEFDIVGKYVAKLMNR
ncbi:riboflavin synthase [Flavobacteriales bacterium]|jgi:riboflavin synthase|nr:riboflavin synthase [Flavobacteriales bacterium]MDC0015316.1 riboflavin synthase [Flavobacteriales bacterium]MDC1370832.1 riboflavin synthase [Flavobacteriales bacterium]|tara:strand:+ start:1244 stop:1822 length:579 start_codon:yes stop_codon:yes gene_type:complete